MSKSYAVCVMGMTAFGVPVSAIDSVASASMVEGDPPCVLDSTDTLRSVTTVGGHFGEAPDNPDLPEILIFKNGKALRTRGIETARSIETVLPMSPLFGPTRVVGVAPFQDSIVWILDEHNPGELK